MAIKTVKIQGNVDSTMQVLDNNGLACSVTVPSTVEPGHLCAFLFTTGSASATVGKKIPAGHKFVVLGVQGFKKAAGGAGDTLTIKKNTTAITNAIDLSGADKSVFSAGTIDDAQNTLDGDAGDTLNAVSLAGGANPSSDFVVLAMRTA